MEMSQDIVSATQWIYMSQDLVRWRNSRSVGWRSDYEGHQFKEATPKFKNLFIGIVYKATWKAMKKKTFIPLPCLPTFLHLRKDQKMIVFDLHLEQWQEQFYIMMLWQYKLYKKCPKLTLHAVAIQAVQKLSKIDLRRKQIFVIFNDCRRYASKCWLLPVDGVFNWRLTNIEAGFILQPFF